MYVNFLVTNLRQVTGVLFLYRWRPETHTFHLPCGEMTLTMQDVKAILGLRLGGLPGIEIVDNDHWRELVAQFTGFLSPYDEASKKNK